MTQQSTTRHSAPVASGPEKPARKKHKKQSIRRWHIMIPFVYLFFILFFFLVTALSLSSGSMFLIIFGPLLALFWMISGPPLLIAFKRPDQLYPTGKPPVPLSRQRLCLILLCTDLLAVVLAAIVWLVF